MRVAELLRKPVVDAGGNPVGRVDDIRVVQDGPYVEGFGAALRVDALVVGVGAVAARVGFHRHRVRGPWLLKRLFRLLERRARVVPWDRVAGFDGDAIRLRVHADELPTLLELGEDRV